MAPWARAYSAFVSPGLYESLGLSQNATPAEVRDSYVRLAKQHHPDKGGDPQHFIQVQTAYAALRQHKSRVSHDGPHGQSAGAWGGAGEGRAAWSLGCSLILSGSGMGAAACWARERR